MGRYYNSVERLLLQRRGIHSRLRLGPPIRAKCVLILHRYAPLTSLQIDGELQATYRIHFSGLQKRVYDRLLLRRPGPNEDLNFETLAVLATDSKGSVDEDKLKDLIKIFRPDRDGRLTRLAFCKSIDTVYKRLRLLSANIHNSRYVLSIFALADFESTISLIFFRYHCNLDILSVKLMWQ